MADEEIKDVELIQSAPTPEPPKEEKIVEIPVDVVAFQANIETAFRALGKARKALEGSIPYEKFVAELTALEKNIQDIVVRVGQLHELDSVLASTQFTNKSEVDARIRTRVIEEISKHFVFTKIGQEVANADDLVVLPSTAPIQPTQPVVEKTGPARDLSAVASREKIRRQARAEAMKEAGLPTGQVASAYEAIFEKDNAVVQEEEPIPGMEEEQISPEEAAQIFGDSAVDPKIEALKSRILPKRLKSGPVEPRGANRGIARSK
jgi:hypothetical protein